MALRYFKTGATVWNLAASWSSTSASGVDNAGIPLVADDVFFTSASGLTCAISTTAGVCKTLTCTGYTGTITTNVTLTISGNVTLGTSSVHNGTAAMICNATATLTSASNANINCPFTLSNLATSNTYTLADNWTFNGLFSTSSNAGGLTNTINGNNIFCKAGFTINTGTISSATLTTGTTVINMTGTGTIITSNNSNGGLGNTFIINTSGTITMPSNMYYRTGTFRYTTGTLSGTTTLNITGSCTLDTNGYASNITLSCANASTTITLTSNFNGVALTLTNTVTINGFTISISSNFSATGGAVTGTTVIKMTGTGTLSSTSTIGMDLVFESGVNTITITSFLYTPRAAGSSITYTNGTINHSGTFTINGPNTVTLNTSDISWNNIIVQGSSFTININSPLTILGTLSFQNQNYTFTGTSGFTAATLSYTSVPTVTNTGIVLKSGITYIVTTALNLYSTTIPTYLGIKSSTPGSVAYLNLSQGASMSVGNVQVTDIDSSAAQSIWAWLPGTLSNASNWKNITPLANQVGLVGTYAD